MEKGKTEKLEMTNKENIDEGKKGKKASPEVEKSTVKEATDKRPAVEEKADKATDIRAENEKLVYEKVPDEDDENVYDDDFDDDFDDADYDEFDEYDAPGPGQRPLEEKW